MSILKRVKELKLLIDNGEADNAHKVEYYTLLIETSNKETEQGLKLREFCRKRIEEFSEVLTPSGYVYIKSVGGRKGNRVKVKTKCNRCGGSGKFNNFSHVDNGLCFACHGTGKSKNFKTITVSTESETKRALIIKWFDKYCDKEIISMDRFCRIESMSIDELIKFCS